jgi:hypothetical protein
MTRDAMLQSAKGSNNGSNLLSIETIVPPVEKVNPDNFWADVAAFDYVLVEHVARESIRRWEDRLAGTDVYAMSNAQAMLESVRIDWGILGPFGVVD